MAPGSVAVVAPYINLGVRRDMDQEERAKLAASVSQMEALVGVLKGIIGGPVEVAPDPSYDPNSAAAQPINTRFGAAPPELSFFIRAFWPTDVWVQAAELSYLESSWSPKAELNTLEKGNGQCGVRYWYSDDVGWATTEQSVGYFQINICAHGGDREHWWNARNNAKKGAELYAASGWLPWQVSARRLGLI